MRSCCSSVRWYIVHYYSLVLFFFKGSNDSFNQSFSGLPAVRHCADMTHRWVNDFRPCDRSHVMNIVKKNALQRKKSENPLKREKIKLANTVVLR